MPSERNIPSITLMAFGRRGYGLAAHNVILSLRHRGYSGDIHLWITDELSGLVPDSPGLHRHALRMNDPGWAKLELPEIIDGPTMYLDADSIAVGDITPLLMALDADGREFITSVQGTGTGRSTAIKYFGWADPKKVAEKEGFGDDAPLYGIQSSWMFMQPGRTLEAIADRAKRSYIAWTERDLKHRWGASKPDELFWSIGCTAAGHDPSWPTEPMWFGGGSMQHGKMKQAHCLMTIPGNNLNQSLHAKRIYDAEARLWSGHKSAYIFSDKHTNYKKHHDIVPRQLLRQPQAQPAPRIASSIGPASCAATAVQAQ